MGKYAKAAKGEQAADAGNKHKQHKNLTVSVSLQSIPVHQVFLMHLSQGRLTDAVEMLESVGITRDLAIFFISYFQGEVANV
jgi:hypothetical protein